ncbi:MAG: NnrU family protein [Alphaproteobacteria bacterium]
MNELFAATVLFVGAHFVLSSAPVRAPAVARLGERRFQAVFSVVMLVAFLWMLLAYARAPIIQLWPAVAGLAWIPVLVMPVALFLAVCGFSTPGPTTTGDGEPAPSGSPATGIFRVTRHPFLWGAALWALSHLPSNGDAANFILMTGILVLSLGGMWHIDRKNEVRLGSDWGPIVLTTSAVPFAALLSRRTRMDWAGIGWWRPVVTAALYVAILLLHEPLLGASAFPA